MANINPFSSLAQLFHSGQQKFGQASTFNPQVKDTGATPAGSRPELLLSDKNSIGLNVVYQSFNSKFAEFSSFNQSQPIETPNEESGLFDFEKVAENVLGFISSSIQAAQSRGVTDSKLESMFDQARSGVAQGIDEAKTQLSDLNLLDEDLEQGIENSRSLINDGIDKLYQNTFSNDEQDIAATKSNNELFSAEQLGLSSIAQSYSKDQYHSQSLSSDLTIETADGDLVTISFSHIQEHMASQRESYAADQSGQRYSYASSSSSYQELNFSFSIEGSLDEDEQKAIGDLIKDISKLQKEFFDGDVNKAFEQALKLGFDSKELNGFSLDLEKTTTSIVSQTYQEVAQSTPGANDLARYTRPLFDFAEQFKQLEQQSNALFGDQFDHLQQLMDKVFEAEFGHMEDNEQKLGIFNNFIEQLK